MAKPVAKTPHCREQCHVNGYTLGHLRDQAKWPTGTPIRLHCKKWGVIITPLLSLTGVLDNTRILYLREEGQSIWSKRRQGFQPCFEAGIRELPLLMPEPAEKPSLQKAFLRKQTRSKSSDCSAEAIRRSSWPICYCLEKSNRTHTHTHTATVTLRRMSAEG